LYTRWKGGCAVQDLNLGELLDNPPPGIDEAVAISRVIRFMRNPDYSQFRAVVFDTAPTGHTLRLLTLPDFFNTGIGKLVRLRFTIANAIGRVTNFFSRKKESGRAVDKAMAKLEELQVCLQLDDGMREVWVSML
jgi:arsenite/tail-anchored protein-transporting ATPase